MKLLNFISTKINIDKNLNESQHFDVSSFDQEKKDFFEILTQTIKENTLDSKWIENSSHSLQKEDSNLKYNTTQINQRTEKNLKKENETNETNNISYKKIEFLLSEHQKKNFKQEFKIEQKIELPKERYLSDHNNVKNIHEALKNSNQQSIKKDLLINTKNHFKDFHFVFLQDNQDKNKTNQKQYINEKNEITDEFKKILSIPSNLTKEIQGDKNFIPKRKSYTQSKENQEGLSTKEIIEGMIKESLKLKDIQSIENPVIGEKNHSTLSKIEIYIKQENHSSFFSNHSNKQNKKEVEIAVKNDPQIKNFIELNQTVHSRTNRLNENPMQNLLDKSIREAFEELIQKAKINVGKENFSAQIRLNPAIFGYMSLDMKLENQSLVIKVLVDNQEVYKRLQENIDSLKNELIKNGIQLEQFHIKIKDTQLSNQNDLQFSDTFSNFKNQQNNFSFENSKNTYQVLEESKINTEENIQDHSLTMQEESHPNFYDSKINVWG